MEREQEFLKTWYAFGVVGFVVLRHLALYGQPNADGQRTWTTAEADLARSCRRSVRTVRRRLAQLQALSLVAVTPRRTGPGEQRRYTLSLLPAGLHLWRQWEKWGEQPALGDAPGRG
jgi:hypothetical protein